MLARFGKVFIFFGIILLLLFVYTDSVGSPYWGYLLLGLPTILVGMAMRWIGPKPEPKETGRFRLLRERKKKKPKDEEPEEE